MAHDISSSSASDHGHSDAHDHHDHHELNFWQKYIFSTDHKIIGIQYGIVALLFLFLGFVLMSCMRWQLAYPGQPLPLLGNLINDLYGGEDGAQPGYGDLVGWQPVDPSEHGNVHWQCLDFQVWKKAGLFTKRSTESSFILKRD